MKAITRNGIRSLFGKCESVRSGTICLLHHSRNMAILWKGPYSCYAQVYIYISNYCNSRLKEQQVKVLTHWIIIIICAVRTTSSKCPKPRKESFLSTINHKICGYKFHVFGFFSPVSLSRTWSNTHTYVNRHTWNSVCHKHFPPSSDAPRMASKNSTMCSWRCVIAPWKYIFPTSFNSFWLSGCREPVTKFFLNLQGKSAQWNKYNPNVFEPFICIRFVQPCVTSFLTMRNLEICHTYGDCIHL